MRGARPQRALEKHVAERVAAQPEEVLLAAVSGGSDSVALAALLAVSAAASGAHLVLGHVNHGLRPTSWQDEAVVLAVGAALRARVLTRSLPEAPTGAAGEARLREGRYAALAEMAAAAGAHRVFTGHHAEDQTETVLLALFRGAGPEGLRGMPARRPLQDGISLERPLLRTSRRTLAAHCMSLGLPLAVDRTNADPRYRRNALRAVLDELRESFPALDEAVARCAEIASDEDAQSERALLRRRIRDDLAGAGALRDVTFERLDAAARGVQSGRRGRHFMKRGVHVEVDAP